MSSGSLLLLLGGNQSTFSPSDISGLTHLYDATKPATVSGEDWTGNPGGLATEAGSLDYVQQRKAFLYEAESGDRHSLATAVTSLPFTVIARVTPIPNNSANNGAFFSSSSVGTANQYWSIGVESGVWVIRARFGANNHSAGTVAVVENGLPVTVAGEWASSTSRRIRVNGGAWEEDTNSAATTDVDQSFLGALLERTNELTVYNGEIHKLAIFNRVLTATEISQMEAWVTYTPTKFYDRAMNGSVTRDLATGKPMFIL